MQLRQDNSQRQTQVQKLAPHLIQANALLQCSNTELLQIIEQEQQENPALESSEDVPEVDGGCRLCPGSRIGSCAHCPFSREGHPLSLSDLDDADHGPSAAERDAALAGGGEDTLEDGRTTSRAENEFSGISSDESGGEGEFDPLLLARTQNTLADQLLLHLRATSRTATDVLVAEYLVDSLDDRGYLHLNLEEACLLLQVPCAVLEEGIARLQACDPPGVGARDLHECLLLQLRYLSEEGDEARYDPIAQRLVEGHWDALVQRRHAPLARRIGVTPKRVEAALAFIQHRLTPNPAAQFRPPWDHRLNGQSRSIRPDVIIRRGSMGFTVEVLGFDNAGLQINPHYRGLYETIRASRHSTTTSAKDSHLRLTPDHEKHVIAYVERANMFLKNLQQRRRTIQKITMTLIECQQGFLDTGNRSFLRPLTRTTLAKLVNMHESTISRALLHKYVQLPTQEVVGYDIFFENAVTIKDTILMLVATEDPDAPLSDQAIADALIARGHSTARRTVVKYREEMRISASYLRRRR